MVTLSLLVCITLMASATPALAADSASHATDDAETGGHARPQSSAAAEPEAFSADTAERLIASFREGLLAMSQRKTMAVFDPGMRGYAELNDQIASLFVRYDSVGVYARILHATGEGAGGTAQVDFTLEAVPPDIDRPPQRHSAVLVLGFVRDAKEWRIANFQPQNFFAAY
jgi:hypothetical protein